MNLLYTSPLQFAKDYLASVWNNKATLAGYIALAGSLSMPLLKATHVSLFGSDLADGIAEDILQQTAQWTLGLTVFGAQTFHSLRKTKEYVIENGSIDETLLRTHRQWYCARKGVVAAAKQMNLEHQVPFEWQ